MKITYNTTALPSEPWVIKAPHRSAEIIAHHYNGKVWAASNPAPNGFYPVARFHSKRDAMRYENDFRALVSAYTGIAADHGIFMQRGA